MTLDPANLEGQSLFERVKSILLRPQATWEAIAAETAEIAPLYRGYALPLAALSALCLSVGLVFFPWSAGGFTTQYGPIDAALAGVFHFVLWLISIYVMARIILLLAPNFGSAAEPIQAHKLAIYSSTAALLSGLFALLPMLSWLGLLGLYSLGLLYIGLPRLMRTPDEKRAQFFAAIIGATFAATLALFLILGSVRNAANALLADLPALQFAEQAPAQAVAAQEQASDVALHAQRYLRSGPALDPARLIEQLPESLPGGFHLETSSSGAQMGTAQAKGEYRNGDARIEVMIVHLGGDGAVAALTPVADVRENRFDANGYARAQRIDGRLYAEQVSLAEQSATYSVLGRGVALSAEGTGVTADQVRAAVDTISIQRLERSFGD